MKIYEINEAVERMVADSVDPETGEVTIDFEALDALQLERDTKIEHLALHIKNRAAEAEAINAEIMRLKERKLRADRECERMKDYLSYVLNGQKFETPKVSCSFRKSVKVDTDDTFTAWASENRPDLLRIKTDVDKLAVKRLLKAGEAVPGATLTEYYNISIS